MRGTKSRERRTTASQLTRTLLNSCSIGLKLECAELAEPGVVDEDVDGRDPCPL